MLYLTLSMLAATFVSLLITFANLHKLGSDVDPNCLTLSVPERIF